MCANCTWLEYVTFYSIKSDGKNCVEINNMEGMFIGCSSLKSVKFSNNIKNVNNISYIFYLCEKLESVDLSNLDTVNLNYLDNFAYHNGDRTEITLKYLKSDIKLRDELKRFIKIKNFYGNITSGEDYLKEKVISLNP